MKVLLVNNQLAGAHNIYPVCGKSTKCYGQATNVPGKGLVFEMSIADYGRDKADIVGSTAPGQQWVPEFVADPTPDALKELGERPDPEKFDDPVQLLVAVLNHVLLNASSYDWNGDPFSLTLLTGGAFSRIEKIQKGAGEQPPPSTTAPTFQLAKFLDGRGINVLRAIAKDAGLKLHNPNRKQIIDAIVQASSA